MEANRKHSTMAELKKKAAVDTSGLGEGPDLALFRQLPANLRLQPRRDGPPTQCARRIHRVI